MGIERLQPNEWESLRSIYEDEFHSAMPDHTAAILVCRGGGALKGFAALESPVWLRELYVAPEYRGGPTALRLLKFVEERVKGRPVLCTPDSPLAVKMCEAFRMWHIAGAIYRKAVV